MSASLNKVQLIGNLGSTPEIRLTQSQKKVAVVSLATTRSFRNDRDQRIEETEWHRVTFFGRLAEIVEQYATTGSQIYVEGRLKTDSWQDKDGITRYSTQIIADSLLLLGKVR